MMRLTLLASLTAAMLLSQSGCQLLKIATLQNSDSLQTYAQRLSEMDASQLVVELENNTTAWESAPSAATRARLGLVRGMWHSPTFSPRQAAEDLRVAVNSSGVFLTADERAFLNFQAAQLDAFARQRSASANSNSRTAELQQALKEAEKKLQAISNIERALSR